MTKRIDCKCGGLFDIFGDGSNGLKIVAVCDKCYKVLPSLGHPNFANQEEAKVAVKKYNEEK